MMRSEDFWKFMIERENIRLRRAQGLPRDWWTTDEIFQTFSFTNIKRVHDRTTALLKQEFYDLNPSSHPSPVALLNAAIFRFHGTIRTARALGWHHTWNDDTKRRMINLNEARMEFEKVFTSAYIIPSCGDPRPKHEVVADIVDGIWSEAEDIVNASSWELMCHRMKRCWGVGSFMAKEVILDYILITNWAPNDWSTWTPVGPGARRGAGVVRYDVIKGIPEWEALNVIEELYADRENHWPSDFVELEFTDIQFQLCEFAKYEKALTGQGRPKRKFKPTVDAITKKVEDNAIGE